MSKRQAICVAVGMSLGVAVWAAIAILGRQALVQANPLGASMLMGGLVGYLAARILRIR